MLDEREHLLGEVGLRAADLHSIVHGTTLVANTVIERTGAAVGLITTEGFRDVIGRIMQGDRLGQATDQFNIRWAALSTELSETLDQARMGLELDPRILANQWVARDDARNYVLFGDPAVRLRVEDMPALV